MFLPSSASISHLRLLWTLGCQAWDHPKAHCSPKGRVASLSLTSLHVLVHLGDRCLHGPGHCLQCASPAFSPAGPLLLQAMLAPDQAAPAGVYGHYHSGQAEIHKTLCGAGRFLRLHVCVLTLKSFMVTDNVGSAPPSMHGHLSFAFLGWGYKGL
jgi:hypothetical protein